MLYYIFAVAFAIPLVIMIYAYGRTGIVLYKSVGEARAMIGQSDRYENSMTEIFRILSAKQAHVYLHICFSSKDAKAEAKADDIMNRIQVGVWYCFCF